MKGSISPCVRIMQRVPHLLPSLCSRAAAFGKCTFFQDVTLFFGARRMGAFFRVVLPSRKQLRQKSCNRINSDFIYFQSNTHICFTQQFVGDRRHALLETKHDMGGLALLVGRHKRMYVNSVERVAEICELVNRADRWGSYNLFLQVSSLCN